MAVSRRPVAAPVFDPLATPILDVSEVAALQAVAAGSATADQQQRAMRVIVEKICLRYEMPYVPGADGERDTCLGLGRMRAGTIITSFLNADIKRFKKDQNPTEQP